VPIPSGRHAREAASLRGLLISPSEQQVILYENADLISEMKETVKTWVKDQAVGSAEARIQGLNIMRPIEAGNGKEAIRPKMCFIEGFLLFPDPTSTSSTNPSNPDSDGENKRSVPQNGLGDEQGTPEERTALTWPKHKSQPTKR
jgi:hypothetical protein